MDIQTLYRDYVKNIKLMQLATTRNNQPWLCNVWFVMDENDHVYWISRDTRRHSQEIHDNPYVSCTFHQWFDGGLGQAGQALIMAGHAEKLSGDACKKPYELYAARYPKILEFQTEQEFLQDQGDHYFYKLTPQEIVWWDEKNFPDQSRQKFDTKR